MEKNMLPDPGVNRWWDVRLVTGQTGNPIKVSLMESFDVDGIYGPKRPGRELYYLRTVAQPDEIKKTCEKILATVGNYRELVGEYYILPREKESEQ